MMLAALLAFVSLALAAPPSKPPAAADPCAKIAGQQFSKPSDVRACFNNFPFNETIRKNVVAVHERVFDFFTFEDYYLNSPPPFQESTTNIRAELARIGSTKYATDFAFNHDLYTFTTKLNDGHTRWFPNCYTGAWQNILPAPVVSLSLNPSDASTNAPQSLFIAPDSIIFLNQLGANFTNYFANINFNWQRLQGAKILAIGGQDPYAYVDHIASTVSGNYLDHGVRVNSVFSSFRIQGISLSQRLGDLAGPPLPDLDSVTMKLLLVGAKSPETVTIPYATSYAGPSFTDSASYYAANCAVVDGVNGIDLTQGQSAPSLAAPAPAPTPIPGVNTFLHRGKFAKGDIRAPDAGFGAKVPASAVGLPAPFIPTVPIVAGGEGVIQSYILPDNKTGVMFVGSFSPDTSTPGFGFPQFENDVVNSINAFQKAGVSQMLIDLSNNGGGFVCLGQFLHQYLAGSQIGYPGFVTTSRGNPLAQKIVSNVIKLGLNGSVSNYAPDNWADLNDKPFADNFNYDKPVAPFVVNGRFDPTSQRFHDICTPFGVPIPTTPPIPLNKVAIIGNANCASTCAMFSTLMVERHNVKSAVWGGKPGEQVQYKGMAGNQVLEWFDIDTEIKTAQLGNDSLAPPDLLVNGNLRHNWRTAWSFLNEGVPIAYESEPAKFRFAYTNETYNQPQKLWEFAAKTLF